MKRLFAQIGITCFTVLAVAFYVPVTAVWIIGGCGLAASGICFVMRKLRKTLYLSAIALSAVFACTLFLGYTYVAVQPLVTRYGGGEHHVEAALKDEAYKSYGLYYYRLHTERIDGEAVKTDLLLKAPESLDAEPDDTLIFSAQLTGDVNNYYRAKGYLLMTDSYEILVDVRPAQRHSLYYTAIQLRKAIRRSIESLLPQQEAALCRAVFIGDKYALQQEVRNDFRYAGASYFIVISGMHFAVICLLMLHLLKRFRRVNRWVRLAIMLALIATYMAITGFQPSVMRSGVMMVVYTIGDIVRRQSFSLNHLGIAGILLPILTSPYAAGDEGLLLSFYATMAILLWATPIADRLCRHTADGNVPHFHIGKVKERLKRLLEKDKKKRTHKQPDFRLFGMKLWNAVASVLAVSLAANLLVFPISVFLFREFSPVTLLSSLLLYPAVYLILILSLAVSICYYLPLFKWAAILLSWPLYLLAKCVLWIVGMLASLPFSFVRVHSSYVFVWVIVTAALMLTAYLLRERRRILPLAVLLSAAVFFSGFLIHSLSALNTLRLEVYECGDGVAVALNCRGDLHLLMTDCKSKDYYRIMREITERYPAAETALCLNDKDYRRISSYSDDKFAFSDVLLYDNKEEVADCAATVFSDDSVFLLDDDVQLDVAVVAKRPAVRVTAGEKTILLLPEKITRSDLPAEWLDTDIAVFSGSSGLIGELSCDEMILSGTEEQAEAARAKLSSNKTIDATFDGDLSVDLR